MCRMADELIPMDRTISEDELQRLKRFHLPMRQVITWFHRRIRPETCIGIEVTELDLPLGWKLVAVYLTPQRISLECYVTHPSFEPTPIWSEVPIIEPPLKRHFLELKEPSHFGDPAPDPAHIRTT
jgi:hypothetical protein